MKSLFTIVGMKHRGTEALVAGLPKGETLTLVREPTNAHDPNAVQVWARGVHIGYVRGTQARGLAREMDMRSEMYSLNAGDDRAKVGGILAVTADRWPCVEADVASARVVEPKTAAAPVADVVIKEGRDV